MSILKNRMFSLPEVMGFFGPFVALFSILGAISLSSWFTWDGNALSDLGHYGNGVAAAVIFNFGLVITSLIILHFTVWFIFNLNDTLTKIGMLPFLIALGFLILVGLLSENFGTAHFIVSVGFFASFPFAMWIVGFGMLRFKHLRWFSLLSVILPFISIIMWGGWYGGIFPFWTGNAIPEMTTALTGILWLWLIWILYGTNNLNQVMMKHVS